MWSSRVRLSPTQAELPVRNNVTNVPAELWQQMAGFQAQCAASLAQFSRGS